MSDPASWWKGASQSVSLICRAVQRKYAAERLAVLWRKTQAPTTYRAPHPWPVNGQSWRAAWLDGSGRPHVRVTLPGGAAELRLRGGPEFGRQMALFRQVCEGDLPRLQLDVRGQPRSSSFHRRGRGESRIMVKMVARLPRPEVKSGRVMTLCVLPEAFWAAELDGRPAWVLNAQHVRRAMDWLAVHYDRLQRLRQDAKAERRCCPRASRAWKASLDRMCEKHRRRMSSWLHEAAAYAVGFAARQGVGELCYDDSRRGGLPLFPWHRLKSLLADKCAAAGILLRDMAPQVMGDDYDDALRSVGEGE
jgi:hypothetical protein